MKIANKSMGLDLVGIMSDFPGPHYDKFFGSKPEGFRPDCHVSVSKTEMVVIMDVPGVKEDAIEISIESGGLLITGYRDTGFPARIESERKRGSFARHFKINPETDIDGSSAKLENGVLTITLPIKAKPNKIIKINDSKSSG